MLAIISGILGFIILCLANFVFFLWVAYGCPYANSLGLYWKKDGLKNLVPPDNIQHRFRLFSLSEFQSGYTLKRIYWTISLFFSVIFSLSIFSLLMMGGSQ